MNAAGRSAFFPSLAFRDGSVFSVNKRSAVLDVTRFTPTK